MEHVGRIIGEMDSRGNLRYQTENTDPSKTVQSDAHLTDVRNIMRQFGQGGMKMLDEAALMFADVSDFTDLKDAIDHAKAAETQFMLLPAAVRAIFEHDVAVWLDTAHDEDKRDALVAGGFLDRVTDSDKAARTEAAEESGVDGVAPGGTEGPEGGGAEAPAER